MYNISFPSSASTSRVECLHLSKEDFIKCLVRQISTGHTPWYDSLDRFDPLTDNSQEEYEERVQRNCGGSSHTTTFPCVKCSWNGNNDTCGEVGICQLCRTLQSDTSKCTHYAVQTRQKLIERRSERDNLEDSMREEYGTYHTYKLRWFDDPEDLMKLSVEELNNEVEKRENITQRENNAEGPRKKRKKMRSKEQCKNFLDTYCDATVFLVDGDLSSRLCKLSTDTLRDELTSVIHRNCSNIHV